MSQSSLSPPLVDVDLNLWHESMRSLKDNANSEPLTMLHEDAVLESNICAIVSPSSTLDEARMGLEILENRNKSEMPAILTTVGVHPYHVNDHDEECISSSIDQMKELVMNHSHLVCAVGECGLDTTEGFPPLEQQLPWFRAQVQLAQECGKPLFVHERGAFRETMNILQDCSIPVIVHCFTGTRQECKAYIKRGYSLSISGFIVKDPEVQACLREGMIPLEHLMVETDAPYMGFDGCRTHVS